jgi:hypothetical protein
LGDHARVTLIVNSPAVVTNFTSYSAGAFARNVAGCNSEGSKGVAFAAPAGLFAGAGVWGAAAMESMQQAKDRTAIFEA